MLKNALQDHILFSNEQLTWEQSVTQAAQPLLRGGYITPEYIEAMIKNIQTNGSYVVILPEIAIPHAQANANVHKTGLALLKLQQPAMYPEEKQVRIVIVLAACDANTHLNLLAELTEVLIDEEKIAKLRAITTQQELLELL